MKKILAIAPYPYLPFFSGGQKFIAQFLEYLGKETDLTVISTYDNDWSLAKNYTPLPFLRKSFLRYIDFTLIRKISKLVKKNNYDTLIWEHPYYAWLAFRVRKRTGVKTIIHTHNIEHLRFRDTGRWWWPVLKIYEHWCFKKADSLFFITPEDKKFAIETWNIPTEKCIDLPFGIEIKKYPEDKAASRDIVAKKHAISSEEKIILFNGVLDYPPNSAALQVILDQINPLLINKPGLQYKIIICGKRLPAGMNELRQYADKNIIYAGFVDNIETYFKAADIFLNPVQSGGGIKTKMVEAIAFGTTVVSTVTGAMGINQAVCGHKLIVVKDNDWYGFAKAIADNLQLSLATPQEYYEYYNWENIIKKMKDSLTHQATGKPVNN